MKIYFMKIGTYLFLTIAVMLASCTKEEVCEVQLSKVENTQVVKDLKNVNLELLSTLPASTRVWRRWSFKEKMQVVSADIGGAWGGGRIGARIGGWIGMGLGSPITGGVFGAAVGAIVGGAYGSWLASPGSRAVVESDNSISIEQACKILINDDMSINENVVCIKDPTIRRKLDMDYDLIVESKLDGSSLNIGKAHNLILSVMDGSVILKNEEQLLSDSSDIKEVLFNSKELIDSCKIVGTEASFGHLPTSDAMLSKVMELFNQVLGEYASGTNDVAFIIGKYIDIIEESNELTTDQKINIKSGLATALYSSEYWESRFEESIK
jgi:uncharacterized protein YcfJ